MIKKYLLSALLAPVMVCARPSPDPIVHEDGYLLYEDGEGGTLLIDPNDTGIMSPEVMNHFMAFLGNLAHLILIPIVQAGHPETIEGAMTAEMGGLLHNLINIMIAAGKEDTKKLEQLRPMLYRFAMHHMELLKNKPHLDK